MGGKGIGMIQHPLLHPPHGRKKNLKPLDYLFYPKNVAVIGASEQEGSIGRAVFENFFDEKKCSYCARVFPVNPNHETILGNKSYSNVKEVPADLDLAVIVVPAAFVSNVFQDCVRKKIESVIIISAGFAEIGEQKLTQELQKQIDKNPQVRVVGPNCFGIFVGDTQLNTTFSAHQKMLLPKNGNVAFISQSGALGVTILDWAATQPFGISKFVSYGNAMDVDESDLLEYLGKDPKTRVITVYLEGVKHGKKFLRIAQNVSKRKPIIVLKGGVTKEAHAATISHTGSLAGSAEVYEGVFNQAGILQARNLMELFNFAKILETEPLPKGNRVQIITNGGGYGIIAADAVVQKGLKLSKMNEKNAAPLRKIFPTTVSLHNPMDLVGDADANRYKAAVEASLKDSNVDMVLVLVLFNTPAISEALVQELGKIKKTAKKPLVVASTGSDFTHEMRKKMEKDGIPTFSYPELAASSLRALWEYSRIKNAK